jgi:polyketide-type polyunsaturated fatty acid synthase PfaA
MKKEPIAIVGIGAMFPGSEDVAAYWNNSLDAKCFIREIPEEFWELNEFYDPDPSVPDKTYSKMAGVLNPVEFNPMEFGIPPKTMQSISVEQIYGLALARQALIDAGLYGKDAKEYDKTRTGVIMSASVGKNVYQLTAKTNAPLMGNFMRNYNVPEQIVKEVIKNYKNGIIEWDEACNPGYLSNVVSGRIANRFNFRGTTCNIDAACAGSLAAVKFACQELLVGDCDIMIAGGITLDISNITFVSFCKTPALSKSDQIRPFDANADGMLLGDGAGAVVLKRLSTAEADGDRIYAVIEGIGSSSDGQEKSIFSPSKEGQVMAVTRAMKNAEVTPQQIGMIEAHGTGTLVGDTCEAQSMSEIFKDISKDERSIVIGGCKGQTGHMRLAAGIASLIRATLAIYHKQFVPSVGCDTLNPTLEKSPFYVCKKPLPWIVNNKRPERYATVSAFGFGGTNYNLILKEHKSDYGEAYRYTNVPHPIILAAENREMLQKELQDFITAVKESPEEIYKKEYTYRKIDDSWNRIGFAASTVEQAMNKAEFAMKMLQKSENVIWNLKGIMYADSAWNSDAGVTALFSGQGSQYRNMLSDVTGTYPEMRQSMTLADNELLQSKLKPISDIVYAKAWSDEEKERADALLIQTQYTQPALAAAEAGLYKVMHNRGFVPDSLIGHSFGELVAIYASGAYDEKTLMKLAVARGTSMAQSATGFRQTGMTAVKHNYNYVKNLIKDFEGVYIANQNSPEQIIMAGSISVLESVEEKATQEGTKIKRLKVSSAFHTPFMDKARISFGKVLDSMKFGKIVTPVISNYTAKEYKGTQDIQENLKKQLVKPVLFQDCIETAYKTGSRIFVEIGPGQVLKGLADSCLSQKDNIITISVDSTSDDSMLHLETALVSLAVLGLPIVPDKYRKRISEEVLIKKKKNTYTVPPTYFYLPETKKKLIEAKNKKMSEPWLDVKQEEHKKQPQEEDVNITDVMQKAIQHSKFINSEKEIDDMNKYDAMYEIQKVNANVIREYVKFQNDQFEQIKDLLNTNQIKTDGDKKLLFDYVSSFQDNCLNALRAYFGGSEVQMEAEAYEDTEKISPKQAEVTCEEDFTEEIKSVVEEVKAESPKQEPEKKEVIQVSEEEIKKLVISTIAEITGYPEDMLDAEMTLEGDLGIDSIKRLELFSNINDQLGNIFGQDDMVTLAVVQSIQECVDIIKAIKEDPDHVVWTEEDLEVAKTQLSEE